MEEKYVTRQELANEFGLNVKDQKMIIQCYLHPQNQNLIK
jgi:hypothetical protein